MKELGESRLQAVHRFYSFERSLHAKGIFQEFHDVINEYFQFGHAEEVHLADMELSPHTFCVQGVEHHHKDSCSF